MIDHHQSAQLQKRPKQQQGLTEELTKNRKMKMFISSKISKRLSATLLKHILTYQAGGFLGSLTPTCAVKALPFSHKMLVL